MLVDLAVGADPEVVQTALRNVATDASNARSRGGRPPERVDAYLRWANSAAAALRNQVTPAEVDRLVLTRAYYALVGLTREPSPHVGEMVDRELDARQAELEAGREALARLRARWPAAAFVVLDTSVFINHPDKLEVLDFREWAAVREEPVHLVVPMVVIDELDGLKRTRGHSGWRAAYSLAVLDAAAPTPGAHGTLQQQDHSALTSGGIPRGRVSVEVWPDPPGHQRLSINDDEIVERAASIQRFAARPVAFVTYDTGQAMRARGARLTVRKLEQPTPRTDTGRGADGVAGNDDTAARGGE